jgi:hypothetical protein
MGAKLKFGSTILCVISAVTISVSLPASSNANSKSAAYVGGYIMAAYFSCPVTATYASMNKFFKYQGTKDYNRGYAAFNAALKGPRPSKVCFDAARESGFFTVR